MRRTVAVVVAAVAGLAILTGCSDQPQRLDGAAAPAGAVQTTGVAVPAGGSSAPVGVPGSSPSAGGSVPGKGSGAGGSGGSPTGGSGGTPAGGGELVLGPDGVGQVRLGMSLEKALRTGGLTGASKVNPDGCDNGYRLKAAGASSGTVWVDGKGRIVSIVAYPGLATAEGIEIGSTRAAVKAAYPSYEQVSDPEPMDGRGQTPVPGGSGAVYAMSIVDGKVAAIRIDSADQSCFE